MAMGFWRSVYVSSTSSNTLHILLSGPYNKLRLDGKNFLELLR